MRIGGGTDRTSGDPAAGCASRARMRPVGGMERCGYDEEPVEAILVLPRMMPKPDETPLMQQWREAKTRHPDALIFFRVGDFYEMFNEDAVEGARLLGLTLTSRNNGSSAETPLAGVPVKAKDDYLERLVKSGRRVAVCEQVEDPALAKGIVRREVVETITPGALLSDSLLRAKRNNWLAALAKNGETDFALGAVDISTGEVAVSIVSAEALGSELGALDASELLLPRAWEGREIEGGDGIVRTYRADWIFDPGVAAEEIARTYHVSDAAGFGFESGDDALIAVLGALLAYLSEIQPASITSLRAPQIRRSGGTMVLDEMTRRNLELTEPLRTDRRDGDRAVTLIDVVDETLTPMGARTLRRWLMRPLVSVSAIRMRHDAVHALLEDATLRRSLRGALKEVRDLERLASRAGAGRITPRELGALRRSLQALPAVRDAAAGCEAARVVAIVAGFDALEDVDAFLASALADELPNSVGDGGVIRAGFNADLDELRETRDGAQDTIARLQAGERERTGIGSLKVGYNKVFGYYIEVTRSNLERVPSEYERRQTIANGERFVTRELKELEQRILGAEDRIGELEARLFADVRTRIASHIRRVQAAADAVAELDVLASFAQTAERRGYTRPAIHPDFALEIRAGRHPVVETMMPRETFIPNDIVLDDEGRIMILTGPNMAGKSTLLRQVGLIQLLAQIGSYVPADHARVPICDRIFTRVGASDNLVRGQSTFMVEMQETAAILNGASRDSLVLLDEIGRGTATYDGVSIAWAVTEHLHEVCGAKTIFATHYHELTQLADLLPALVNSNVAVREVGHDIVFLHRLQPGGADRSYGIEVGRLAGLPASVVDRAREILHDLEGAHTSGGQGLGHAGAHRPQSARSRDQLSLFAPAEHPAVTTLRKVDIDRMTPLDAMNLLAELRRMAGGTKS
jgi:DNA mismatch repair protein MutS